MKIFILHPGKATYPEIVAYKNFFESKYLVIDGTIDDFLKLNNKADYVLWCIMGFFPKKLQAASVIHDYRSLSTGRLAKLKDKIKKHGNTKPNLRIFQNNEIKGIMGFNDGVPSINIPMGVPEWIFDIKPGTTTKKATYCYIGDISKERGMEQVIRAFIKHEKHSNLILIGPTEERIKSEFNGVERIEFTGKISQREALEIVANSKYCISKIPSKYPYDYQAPTKLIEYAALGKIIICNDSPSNTTTAKLIGAKILISSDEIFTDHLNEIIAAFEATTPEKLSNSAAITWPEVIGNSGINRKLYELLNP